MISVEAVGAIVLGNDALGPGVLALKGATGLRASVDVSNVTKVAINTAGSGTVTNTASRCVTVTGPGDGIFCDRLDVAGAASRDGRVDASLIDPNGGDAFVPWLPLCLCSADG